METTAVTILNTSRTQSLTHPAATLLKVIFKPLLVFNKNTPSSLYEHQALQINMAMQFSPLTHQLPRDWNHLQNWVKRWIKDNSWKIQQCMPRLEFYVATMNVFCSSVQAAPIRGEHRSHSQHAVFTAGELPPDGGIRNTGGKTSKTPHQPNYHRW